MLANLPLLSLITFSPLLGVLVLLFVPKDKGRTIKIVGIAATLIPLVLSVLLFAGYDRTAEEAMQFTEEAEWIIADMNSESEMLSGLSGYALQFKYKVGADGMAAALILLTALVSTMAALASVHIRKRWKTFYILYLLLMVGMFGVFAARDLFLFFVFFEVTLVPTFFLIGIWGFKEREKAATKFLIYNGVGSALMLIGFLILVITAGFTFVEKDAGEAAQSAEVFAVYSADVDVISGNLADEGSFVNTEGAIVPGVRNPFHLSEGMAWLVFILLLVAFGIKLPIFPFHTWMLKVHAEAPPAVVMIHSGILLKIGAYGLIRFGIGLFPDQVQSWALVLGLLGVINVLYGAVIAFRQTDFRLVLAYSSISHMGIVLLGLAALNVIGLKGAIFQMVSHGLISALMFLIVGSLYARTETMELSGMGGLARSMPFTSGVLLAAGMASLGLPGLSGFISEFMALLGVFGAMPVIAVLGALGIILTAVYVLRAVLRITFGPMDERFAKLNDARLVEAVPMIALLAFIILIGVYPSALSDTLKTTVDAIAQNFAGKIGG